MKRKFKPGIHVIQDDTGEWYANLIAPNGREIWRTSEIYKRKATAVSALKYISKDYDVYSVWKKGDTSLTKQICFISKTK